MKRGFYLSSFFIILVALVACAPSKEETSNVPNVNFQSEETEKSGPNVAPDIDYSNSDLEKIYFAGGCFWGVDEYFDRIYGVAEVTSGYANGSGGKPTYEEIIYEDRGFAETVEVSY